MWLTEMADRLDSSHVWCRSGVLLLHWHNIVEEQNHNVCEG